MKEAFKCTTYTFLLMLPLIFGSCQSEFEPLPEISDRQTIMASSETARLIEETSAKDGSFDNLVDRASCFAVRFPYTVRIMGNELSIASVKDLDQLEELVDSFEDTEDDILEIIFPITVTFGDYEEIVIEGQQALLDLAEDCIEGGTDDDNECIDFVYPVNVYTLSINEQQTGLITIQNDEEMRKFFTGLDENDLVSLEFPVQLLLHDGTRIEVQSNAELESAIELARDACDEDDDIDYNDDDFTQERLDELLVLCPWLIKEFQREEVNQTEQYFDYVMSFDSAGTVSVTDRAGNSLTGSWTTRVTENRVLLKLQFDVLVDFNLEWYVYELESGKIKLTTEEGDKIVMHKACDLLNPDPDSLREILRECSWIIHKVQVDDAEIRRLLGFEFNFLAEGIVTLNKGESVSQGTWEITTNTQGRLVLAIVMGDEPSVSFVWPLSDLRNDRLYFEIPDTGYELLLERVCDDNNADADVSEIRNILMGGNWVVAEFSRGDNIATEFNTNAFNFGQENALTISSSASGPEASGLWRITRTSEGYLTVYLNVGEEGLPGSLTGVWDLVSITSSRLEMKSVSSDGDISILIFEKIS